MMVNGTILPARTLLALFWLVLSSCSPDPNPQTGSQTNWLRACQVDADCGSLNCQCGVCTSACDANSTCSNLPGSTCVKTSDRGVIALCDGNEASPDSLCLPSCSDATCADGFSCILGICNPDDESAAQITLDESTAYQTLSGIGANLAYVESSVIAHPEKDALYDAMFGQLGLDIVRFRNRFGYDLDNDLTSSTEVVDAAARSLGRSPAVILSSWSPPASLKANASTICQGDFDSCTLVRQQNGTFDYAAYANYWIGSLEAYASVGFTPDYVGIQNNPDFVPPSTTPAEACQFLPTEGTQTVSVNGIESTWAFPGYAEALDAVLSRFTELASPPKIIAPDVSVPFRVSAYVAELDATRIDAISHHLYGLVPTAPDMTELDGLARLGRETNLPLFQTEMQADGYGSAVLMHDAFTYANVSAYLHSALVAPASLVVPSTALITIDDVNFGLEIPYYTVQHYALYTDPGWVRILAESSHESLLTTAWKSPTGDATTFVILNTSTESLSVHLALENVMVSSSNVFRTVYGGIERFAALGPLPSGNTVRLPGQSLVTVVVEH